MISLFEDTASRRDKVSDLLSVLLVSSFTLFSLNTIGAIIMVALVFLIYINYLLSNGGRVRFHLGIFHTYLIIAGLFCFLSAIWAIEPKYAIEKGVTLFEILVAFSLLYEVYKDCSIKRLFMILMWSGFFLSIYAIVFVGIDNLQETLENADRLESSFANINLIGISAASSMLIACYYLFKRNNVLDILFCIPSLLVVAASGSRKALVFLVIGIIVISTNMSKTKRGGIKSNKLLSAIFYCIFIIAIVYLFSKLSIFKGTMARMDGMIASFTGKGEADSSSLIREYFRKIGFEQFLKTPILGIGMGNARILAMQFTGRDCYLHCNYAEIAANGGIVGLVVFYWLYLKLLYSEYRCKANNAEVLLVLLFLMLNLVMDYGMVSYYSKDAIYRIMVFCIHYESLKKINQNPNDLIAD